MIPVKINIPEDADLRRRAVDTRRSCHVEAPAGSGKTLLLTRRFIALLGEVSHPREILALTFTDKAAGEMRNRILSYLRNAQMEKTSPRNEEAEILASARRALAKQHRHIDTLMTSDGLNIMTFHGFCNYIIRRAPVEAGVAPEVHIIDETAQALFIDEVLQKAVRGFISLPRRDQRRVAFERRLLHHNNNWVSIIEEMGAIVTARRRIADLAAIVREAGDGSASSIHAALEARLRRYIENRLASVKESFMATGIGGRWPAFMEYLVSKDSPAAAALPAAVPGVSWEELPAWCAIAERLLTDTGHPRKQLGPGIGFPAGFSKSSWAEMIREMGDDAAHRLFALTHLPAPSEPVAEYDLLADFIIYAASIIDAHDTLCLDRAVVDFTGLEQAALSALDESDPSELYLSLDHRIRHLLIDEFQDTDRNQWEMVKRLCAGWESGDGRTVFIVGDPKQSIYAFRNAEVRLFIEARNGIPRIEQKPLDLVPLTLTTNFRQSQRLIDWVNDLFAEEVMVHPDDDADEVPFGPSTYGEEKREDAGRISLSLFADEDRARAQAQEARWLARRVRDIIDETASRSTVAVLLFTRNRLSTYLAALTREGVPVQVEEGLRLADRPEIMHLLQMSRMLSYPHDDLAWASFLRSPWCWFDKHTLLSLATTPAESWSRKLHLAAGTIRELAPFVEAVDHALQRAGRDHLAAIVKKLWQECGGAEKTAHRYGMAGVANCMRFFDTLEKCEQGTPQETLRRLERIIDTAYEPVDPAATRSPVHMMTVHRAKGLEFDIVFLPFMDWKPLASGPRTPPPYLIERLPATDGAHLIAMGADRRTGDPLKTYTLLRTLERNRRWGEAKRLFYVAATRAKTELSMSGAVTAKEGRPVIPDRSVLRWVTGRYGSGEPACDASGRTRGMIEVALNPSADPRHAEKAPPVTIPSPRQLIPERIPGEAPSPSHTAYGHHGDSEVIVPQEEGPAIHRQRGTVIHRLIATLISGGVDPSENAVRLALAREGIPEPHAREAASECLREARMTVSSPFIAGLITAAVASVKFEWAIEDMDASGLPRSGVIDLAVHDGSSWWIVDFKTGRPGMHESEEEFTARHADLYRGQMTYYRDMVLAVTGVKRSQVRSGLYLTAIQRWVELTPHET